jgi:hypothetical protein
MSRRTGLLFWDAVPARPIPRAAANHSRVTVQGAFAGCDHGAPAGRQLQSTHRTSAGTVAYARCPCGARLVLLDGQRLAVAAHRRPRAATPPVPGERPRGRGRVWSWLWNHGQALWKWTR